MQTIYRLIMDPDRNPLRGLPSVQRFQIMLYLSLMWTTIFCSAAGAWLWYGEIMVAHALIALGIVATGWTFTHVNNVKTYRDHPLTDGTARYDDVWGA